MICCIFAILVYEEQISNKIMRLGQIKRSYGIEPSKVVNFLKKKEIDISKHPNSKVTEEQLEWILEAFKEEIVLENEVKQESVDTVEEEVVEEVIKDSITVEQKKEPKIGEVIELPTSSTKTLTKKHDLISTNEEEENIEVIRAPKVEIEGVKVLGKIDLPEPKKIEKKEEVEEEKVIQEEVEIDPLAHIHPSKRAKMKVDDVIAQLPEVKNQQGDVTEENNKAKSKKAKEIKTDKPKSKKKKQIERDEKLKAAQKAREEQEYIKKHGKPKHQKQNSPKRIQVRADGTIIPKHEVQEESKKQGFFARFWRWFNT